MVLCSCREGKHVLLAGLMSGSVSHLHGEVCTANNSELCCYPSPFLCNNRYGIIIHLYSMTFIILRWSMPGPTLTPVTTNPYPDIFSSSSGSILEVHHWQKGVGAGRGLLSLCVYFRIFSSNCLGVAVRYLVIHVWSTFQPPEKKHQKVFTFVIYIIGLVPYIQK